MRFYFDSQLPKEVIYLIHFKAQEFQTDGIQRVDSQDIKNFLLNFKWKNRRSIELCDMIDDIMSLQFSELFDFLRAQVIVDAQNKDLNDFQELIQK